MTTITPDKSLKDRLKHIEAQIGEARDERAAAAKERDAAKRAYAGIEGLPTNSPEFKSAQDAVAKLGDVDDKIADLSREQVGILKMIDGDHGYQHTSNGNGRKIEPAASPWDVKGLLSDDSVRKSLQAMSASRMKVGRVAIGELATAKAMAADIRKASVVATPNMRRDDYAGVVGQLRRRLRIVDLLPVGEMSQNSLPYTQESGSLVTAVETAEGAIKPEAAVTYADATAEAHTIAHWLKNKKQVLADFPALESIIADRLRYGVERRLEDAVLAGSGVGDNIRGVLNTTGIGTVAYSASELIADQVLKGITQILLADAEPTAIVMSPSDWSAALVAKATGDGHYFSGGPYDTTPSVMWGVPLVASSAIPAGTALVGDFLIGAQLFIREGVNVLVSDGDSDDFTRNLITILAECRAALAVWRPSAFTSVRFIA